MPNDVRHSLYAPTDLSRRQGYGLLTTLVVPRPIGWISTRSAEGVANLAPFSYFNALSAAPLLVAASIARRSTGPKDTLANIRDTGAFCVNIVTERHLDAMVRTAGDYPADVDEFEVAGLPMAEAGTVDAPFVADCPAVLECRLFREVDLGDAPNTLIIGQVTMVRLDDALLEDRERMLVDPQTLKPVGRLGAERYSLLGELRHLPRPRIPSTEHG
ncbi:MAG: flavin reductase family protein [Gemmatimonadota bacterium]|jgi:flavin reductase (DIM6/NTAB) family NADH-FMN oxidoreductase RutF